MLELDLDGYLDVREFKDTSDGTIYKVRKMGAGEQLAWSQDLRRIDRLQKKAKTREGLSKEDQEEMFRIERRSTENTAKLFDDGGDGTKSLELVNKLSDQSLADLLEQIWSEPNDKAEQST